MAQASGSSSAATADGTASDEKPAEAKAVDGTTSDGESGEGRPTASTPSPARPTTTRPRDGTADGEAAETPAPATGTHSAEADEELAEGETEVARVTGTRGELLRVATTEEARCGSGPHARAGRPQRRGAGHRRTQPGRPDRVRGLRPGRGARRRDRAAPRDSWWPTSSATTRSSRTRSRTSAPSSASTAPSCATTSSSSSRRSTPRAAASPSPRTSTRTRARSAHACDHPRRGGGRVGVRGL